jgi:AcrR family transcriptional regulator
VAWLTTDNLLDAMIAKTTLSKKQTDKQQRVVETAIRLFAEKGYANTSTSEIAREAGVAEGTIFRHFSTKDNLLLSVLLPFIKESIPSMAENVFNTVLTEDMACFEDFLRAILKDRIQFIHENKEIFQVFIKEFLYSEELRKEFYPYFSENIGQRFTKVIEMYISKGDLIEFPSNSLQKTLFTFVGGYFVSRFVLFPNDIVYDDDVEIENILRFIMDGVRKKAKGHRP